MYESIEICNFHTPHHVRCFPHKKSRFVVNEIVIDEYDNIDLLGIKVDNQLNFAKHISNICRRVHRQLQVLKRFQNLAPRDA